MIIMNKKTTLLGLLGLVAVSGAGYFYTTGQTTPVTQQIGSYLPESIRDYLPASFSPDEPVIKQTDEKTTEQMAGQEQELETNDENLTQNLGESQLQADEAVVVENDELDEKIDNDDLTDGLAGDVDNIDSEVIGKIEESVAEMAEPKIAQAQPENNSNKSKEIQELEQRLKDVTDKISGLDDEKTNLEDQFQNVLKQNRALAIKLKDIDDQLKINMK